MSSLPTPKEVDVEVPARKEEERGLLDAVREMNRDALGVMRTALATKPPKMDLLLQSEDTLSSALSMLRSLGDDPTGSDYSPSDARACMALTLNNLACVYRRLGREEAALSTLHQAAHAEEALRGQPSCSTLCNLCTVLVALGRADEGIPVAARCVKLARSLHPTETTPDMLVIALHNYAMAQQHSEHAHQRRHAPATMSEALAEARKALGEGHSTTQMLYSKCGLPPNLPEKRPVIRAPAPPPTRGDSQFGYTRPKDAAAVAVRHGVEAKTDPNALYMAAASAQAIRTSKGGGPPSANTSPVKSVAQPPPTMEAEDVAVESTPAPQIHSPPQQEASPTDFTAFTGDSTRGRIRHPNAAALLYAARPRGVLPKAAPAPLPDAQSQVVRDIIEEERNRASFLRHLPITTQTIAPLPVSYADIRDELMLERKANDELTKLRRRQGAMMKGSNTTTVPGQPMVGGPSTPAVEATSRRQDGTHAHATKGIFSTTAARKKVRLEEEAKEEQLLRAGRKKMDDHLRQEHDRRQKLTRLHEARRQQGAVVVQRAFRSYWRDQVQPRRLRGIAGDVSAGVGAGAVMAKSTRTVVKCGRIWLRKTAARRLLLRIACVQDGGNSGDARRLDLAQVERHVLRIQCAFRVFVARRQMKALKVQREMFRCERERHESRLSAASSIQAQHRRLTAKSSVALMKAEYYTTFVVRLQGFIRSSLKRCRVRRQQRKALDVSNAAATHIQRLWRGYQGRVRACMVRIRAKITSLQRKENRHTALLSRVLGGYRGRCRVGRMYWRADQKRQTGGDASATPTRLTLPTSPDTPPLSPYSISALNRSEEVSRVVMHEQHVHGVELHARPVEQRFLDDLLEEHCAPTQTQVIKIRAEEQLQRDLERSTLVRIRSCILIQRVFRAFLGKIRTCPGAASRYEGRRLRAQQASFNRRILVQKEEQARLGRAELVGDLAADARETVRELKSEVEELTAHVRVELPRAAVRSVRTRTADAKLCRQMEDELDERVLTEKVKLRQPPLPSVQPFIKARQQLKLQDAAAPLAVPQ